MMNGHDDIGRARSALYSLDPGVDRETWVKVLMASKAAGLAFDDVDAWSSVGANYKSAADCQSVWRSIDANGPVKAGTLFAMARESGWQDGDARSNGHTRPSDRAQEPRQASAKPGGSLVDCAAVWRDAEPATAEHPYIARKLGLPAGLRVYRGSLRMAGQSIDGALLVPAFDAASELMTWQAIPAQAGATKLNCHGRPVKGWFVVGGPLKSGDTVYLCEGIGAAWSAHQATRSPAVVSFGSGRIEAVARALLEHHKGLRLVLAADVGKEGLCEKLATELRCGWIAPPADLAENGDLNDLHKRSGLQAVADLLRQATQPVDPDAPEYASLIDVETNPPPDREWVIEEWLPRGTVAALFGAGGGGKTLLAQQLASCIPNGMPAFGKPVTPGPVLAYLCEDDTDELRRRQRSIFARLDLSPRQGARNLHIAARAGKSNTLATFDAEHQLHRTRFFDTIERECDRIKPILVIIDNISQVYAGTENDRHEVTSFCNLLSGLALRHRCTVLLLGHVAKAQGSEYSGSTAWENAVRTRLWLERREDGLTELHRKKANYSGRDSVTLEYRFGAFAEVSEVGGAEPLMVKAAEHIVLKALDTYTSRQVATSGNPTARTFLPRMASKEGMLAGTPLPIAIKALAALIDRGEVVPNASLGWRNSTRHHASGLARVGGFAPEEGAE